MLLAVPCGRRSPSPAVDDLQHCRSRPNALPQQHAVTAGGRADRRRLPRWRRAGDRVPVAGVQTARRRPRPTVAGVRPALRPVTRTTRRRSSAPGRSHGADRTAASPTPLAGAGARRRTSERRCDTLRAEPIPAPLDAHRGRHGRTSPVTAGAVDFSAQQSSGTADRRLRAGAEPSSCCSAPSARVPVAMVAVVLNLLSVGGAYGLLTLVFQHTLGRRAARLQTRRRDRRLAAAVPVRGAVRALDSTTTSSCVSRIREACGGGMPAREAVRRRAAATAGVGDERGGGDGRGVRHLRDALGQSTSSRWASASAAAVLIDATIVRVVLMPARWCCSATRPGGEPAGTSWPSRRRSSSRRSDLPRQRAPAGPAGARCCASCCWLNG